MKKCWRLGVLVVWCASANWAVDWKALPSQGYVSDFAGVIDAPTKARLESYGASIENPTGVRMALVTISSLQGEPIEDVADTIARAWGFVSAERYQAFLVISPGGSVPHPALPPLDLVKPPKTDGILLLLAIQDHRFRLEIGHGLRDLPDGLNGSLLHEMQPALRQQQYGEAFMAAAETLGGAIAKAKHRAIESRLPRSIRPGAFTAFPWALAIGSVILAAWLMRAGGPRGYGWGGRGFLPWMVLGAMTARSTWGGRGSGGFGGYDSGDGFGGFGGGDFGGGGASSDW